MIETFGDVGQDPDEREGVQDRRDRDDDRHQHRRQRAEDEEQDHEAAEAADQRLGEHARAAARATGRGVVERVAPGQVGLHALGRVLLELRPHLVDVHRRAEGRRLRRVDLGEGRVPVLRDVGAVLAGREVRRVARAGVDRRGCRDRLLDPGLLGDVAVGVEDRHERRLLAGAEGLQRPLVRLVRRVARDREALEPALRHLARREGAEQRQHDPRRDHDLAAADDQVREPREPRLSLGSAHGVHATDPSGAFGVAGW